MGLNSFRWIIKPFDSKKEHHLEDNTIQPVKT